jgi:aspartyl-tRNA(Asn)/glutamyl-tRNA(Gln) amidotransferase subunit C
MKVDHKETRRIAALARIELDDAEVAEMARDLTGMLEFVEKISELDTANVAETDHVLDIRNITRKDETVPSLDSAVAMKLGPETDKSFYVVPAIIE